MFVAVLALGTVGDVRPLAALALRLAAEQEGSHITVITHRAHQASGGPGV